MRVSVVVPVLNETEWIDACVVAARQDYSHDEVEILVVDGGSSDGTRQRVPAEERVIGSPQGRAVQMNHGANESTGEIRRMVRQPLRSNSATAWRGVPTLHPRACGCAQPSLNSSLPRRVRCPECTLLPISV